MKPIQLGNVCPSCFNALNFNLSELQPDQSIGVQTASHELSKLADREGITSLHTEESAGYSASPCAACGNVLAGERWPLIGLKQTRKDLA